MPSDHWTLQIAQVTDVAFIIDSWCNDEAVNVGRHTNEDPEIGKVGMRGRVLRLLSSCKCALIRPTSAWFQARGETPDLRKILGWICFGLDRSSMRPIIHFLYVKGEHRRQGLADALLLAAGCRAEKGAWCTTDRLRLARAMNTRGIFYNKYLLDYDPAAGPVTIHTVKPTIHRGPS